MDNFDAWLVEISAKLKRQGKSIEDILFNEQIDLIEKPLCNEQAKSDYKAAIELVSKWFLQGKCLFRFKDLNKPYWVHTINIRWRTKEDDVEVAMSELRELCSRLNDELLIDEKGEWQLSTIIYTEDRS